MKLQIKWAMSIFSVISAGMCSAQLSQKDPVSKTDSLLGSYYEPETPGMAVAIIKNGKVIYKKTSGLANMEDHIPITDSTAFNIASVSKQFTAFIALLAEKEGKLSLEDDIKEYLPELKGLPYKITVRQLANHTHGLPNFTEIKKLQGLGDEFKSTNREAAQTVLAIKSVNFAPGEQYQYNNTGFILLAEILHRVYKKDFAEIVRENIFNLLNMNHSMSVDDSDKIIPNRAESYMQKKGAFFKLPIGQMADGASNIYTTLNDLCKWAVDFQKPSDRNRKIYDQMQKNTLLGINKNIQYGLGLQSENYKGLDIVFHGGGTAGYRTYILHVPSQQFSIVILLNKQGFEGLLIAYQLVDFFLADKQVLPVPQKIKYKPSELKKLEGIYELGPGNYLEISAEGKDLYLGTYHQKGRLPLHIIGDNTFSFPQLPTSKLTFYPGSVTFRIADFTYVAQKVTLNPPKADKINLNHLIGFYRNEEFNTMYQFLIINDTLVARHSINGNIQLYPLTSRSFYSTTNYFGQVDFKYDKNNTVTGFMVSGTGINNIEFKRIK